ncbi:alpha/beta fold hydrolase [Corallococcus silvisoli]|uniref:alpha/beta fold hydrolase n=1 Tax=Corallococcus silvisoli TaxID=2697031 RepID=UPI00137661B7|nr:alpha/beta hydrolase [Corallococcus silvisoli]NBD08403.1 alpha/beta fold hydrolase [Corallococcus silvisoli]
MTPSKFDHPPHTTPRREVWFESDGARLFALDVGQGHPVVFLHGGLADHRAALFRVAKLADTHRLLCPDLRGSGRSIHTGPLSWDRLADDVAALLGHLGVEHAVIGGTSMGSAVALRVALRHPRLLRGLILMSPLYPGAERPMAEAVTAALRAMGEAGERALEQGVESLRPLFERLPSPVRDVALEMMLGFDAGSVAASTRFLARREQPMHSVRELESFDVPVMVLPGIDPQHPAEVAELYLRHLRHPVRVELTSPDMLERVERFCRELDGRPSR